MRIGVRMTRNTWVSVGPVGCLAVICAPSIIFGALLDWAPGRIILALVLAVVLSPLLLLILGGLVLAAKPILMRIYERRTGAGHG